VRAVNRLSPRLVLMDLGMPGMGGLSATRVILSRHPRVVVVLISVNDPALDPRVTRLGSMVVCTRKQDLCPSRLRHLWQVRCDLQPRAASAERSSAHSEEGAASGRGLLGGNDGPAERRE